MVKGVSRQDKLILEELERLYPEPRSELHFEGEFQLVVAVVLSAQCTDKKVNEVTPALFERYPNFQALANAKVSTVEQLIRPVNYYKTKSRNLIALAERVTAQGGNLPRTLDTLVELPGVGRKTASVVLGELGIAFTLPVDTHVFRVSQRLGFAQGKTVRDIEDQLRHRFPQEQWRKLHHWLILHGRRVCKAQHPLCESCTLRCRCPSAIHS